MAAFKMDDASYDDQMHFMKMGNRCATTVLSEYDILRIDQHVDAFRKGNKGFSKVEEDIVINVQYIHLVDGNRGQVSARMRRDQTEVMNAAFGPHRIRFTYDEGDTIVEDNPAWLRMGHRSREEREAKRALQVDPQRNLNFYTADPPGGLLGFATFPSELRGDPERDGVVVRFSSLPGGGGAPFNLGQTATHEVGHWLGLFHTFQGGCDGVGDQVGDTVAHAQPNFGRPPEGARNNACSPREQAPIHNFMNYVDDAIMDHFTPNQGRRMRNQVGAFRPLLLEGSGGRMEKMLTAMEYMG